MKRPWNIPDLPVYSLATYGQRVNMNICTYVTAISMKPKLYAIGIYQNTQTLENMYERDLAVLQLLNRDHYPFVKILGKKSGKAFDKQKWLKKNNLLEEWHGFKVLKGATARLLLQKLSFHTTGDHVLFVFKVLKFNAFDNQPLTTSVLGEKNIISI